MMNFSAIKFMENKDWYTTNENGELVLTDNAPKEARIDYEKHRKEYIDRVGKMSLQERMEDSLIEDHDWFIFPLDDEQQPSFSSFGKDKEPINNRFFFG